MKELRGYARALRVLIVARRITALSLVAVVYGQLLLFPEGDFRVSTGLLLPAWGIAAGAVWWLKRREAGPPPIRHVSLRERPWKPKGPIGMFVDAWRISPSSTILLMILSMLLVRMSVSMILLVIHALGVLLGHPSATADRFS